MLHRLCLRLNRIIVLLLRSVSISSRKFMLYWTCWRTVLVGISTESVLELGFERLSIAGRFEGNVTYLNLRGCVGEGQSPWYGFPIYTP